MDRRDWERWFPEERAERPSPPSGRRTRSRWPAAIAIAFAAFIVVLILANIGRGIYTEWLWFSSLGYGSVFATTIKTKTVLFFIAASMFGLFLLANLVLATRLVLRAAADYWPWSIVKGYREFAKWGVIAGTAVTSMVFGLAALGNWETVLRFANAQPFGILDPVFNQEVGFYVFTLPFLHFIHGWLLAAMIVTLLATVGVYALSYTVRNLRISPPKPVLWHSGGLLLAVLALFAWGYWLGVWQLPFSSSGVVFGAGYADIHARLPGRWIMIGVMVVVMAIAVIAIARRRHRWLLYSAGGWVAAVIIVGGAFPALVQRLQVQPNELERERPYIDYSIQFTRQAFALDRIEEQAFPAQDAPSARDIDDNALTVSNIRLWDPRPLKDTYNQIQAIRLYYDFNDVDIDRYSMDGDYRQVMLSARELSVEKLDVQAQTWVNRHLQFTHGYGFVMSPVNEITAEGLPLLWVKDIPPAGMIEVEHPEVYFGERTNHYVIVGTNTEEFDYPLGDDNVYGRWEGGGGVSLRGLVNRLAYSWEFGDINVLISGELTGESRLLYRRNIVERVAHLAPFLRLDRDPYLVVADGRLFWVQDAYTTTDRYPYSQPYQNGINYIRNSVKIVTDAYDGTVTLYVADAGDPLIQTYRSIFPALFAPIEEMPATLKSHLRYPEDMFLIQASLYQSYHMRDIRVFYNKEDLWAMPREVYGGSERLMEPYYVIMRLPDEEREEFLLMLPFTPVNKGNAIGWLAARSDGENYGRLLAYLFPKERLVFGPSQIENRIQQDTVITEQLALWSRGGSNVIRGNLLLIPLAESKLYVEPVFLQSQTGGLPELKRVIVAIGDRVAMTPTLKESLAAIFATGTPPPTTPPTTTPPPTRPPGQNIASLIDEAQARYDRAQERLREGDWTGYGQELEALKDVLNRLSELTGTP